MAVFVIAWILLTTPIILGTYIASATTTATEDGSPTTLTTPTEEPEPEPEPSPLIASMTIDSTNGDTAPATFLFETEPEGGTEPYTFSWDFGDGSPPSNEQNTEHTFENAGTFTVSLTVTDSAGNFVLEEREVTVRPATTTTPTNVTTPTTNQTETTEPEAILCPAPLRPGTPIDLRSGNGPVGSTDPLNQFSTDGGTTWNSAFIVQKIPAWHLISGTRWISSDPGRLVPQSGDVWYRVTFTLPAGFSIPSLEGRIHVDNSVEIYLNSPPPPTGNRIPITLPGGLGNFQDPSETFGTTTFFVTGTNTLYFRVSNFGGPTGLDYHATVRYCQAVVDLPVERTCAEGIPTIVGTPGPDTLPGTAGPDFIAGRGGSDIINGLGGDDIICGDAGNDPQLFGGAGNDRIIGGAGNDGLNGGAGNDGMWGEAGLDGMAGGAGNDGLNGGTDADTLNGDAGDDVIDSRDTPMSSDILNGGTHIIGDYCISGPGDTRVPGTCEFG